MDSSAKITLSKPVRKLLRETLLDLANLPDDAWTLFRRRRLYVPFKGVEAMPSDEDLLNWRLWLRRVWEGDDQAVRFALAAWTREATRHNVQSWVFDSTRPYSIKPNYKILALSLAVGVSEALSKMGVCANPQCAAPYFLKGRRTQRFCDTPGCVAYGQREHKRIWWKKHGQEWKENRETKKKQRGEYAKAKKA